MSPKLGFKGKIDFGSSWCLGCLKLRLTFLVGLGASCLILALDLGGGGGGACFLAGFLDFLAGLKSSSSSSESACLRFLLFFLGAGSSSDSGSALKSSSPASSSEAGSSL